MKGKPVEYPNSFRSEINDVRCLSTIHFLCALALLPGVVAGQVVPLDGSQIPHGVVKDDTGEIIGPVVDFESRYPTILLTVGDDRLLATVTKEGLFMSHLAVYYSDASCDGTVVGIQRSESLNTNGGLYQMQNRDYAIGKGNIVYRDIKGTGETKSPSSVWKFQDLSDPDSIPCNATSANPVLRDAEVVDDLDSLYVSPFLVE